MIDEFCIFNKGGAVLWSRKLNATKGNPVDDLIQNVLLEERSGDNSYALEPYMLKWVFANEVDLVFVAVYLNIAPLPYIDQLLEVVKKEFIGAFKEQIEEFDLPYKFDSKFDAIIGKFEEREAEAKAASVTRKAPRSFSESRKSSGIAVKKQSVKSHSKSTHQSDDDDDDEGDTDEGAVEPESAATDTIEQPTTTESAVSPPSPTPIATAPTAIAPRADSDDERVETTAETVTEPEFKMNVDKLKRLASMRGGKKAPLSRQASKNSPAPEPFTSPETKKGKEKTMWADRKLSIAEKQALDFSSPASQNLDYSAQAKAYGVVSKTDKKVFEYDDADDDADVDINLDSEVKEKKSTLFGWFQQLSGNKVLDKDDLAPVLENMRQALMTKNVAAEIAAKLCNSVQESLIGQKLGSFTSVAAEAKKAMEEALTRILTPRRPVDILHGIQSAKEEGRPYTVVFCGVNGVGKSTSLAKITNFLQAHSFKVSLVACDTFRAGAVEQLRTHSKCLGATLFEQGYDKDAALVAQSGIRAAKTEGSDVVLVDTAGRMQNNDNLMKALAKLIHLNNPDLVLFVGEALVGNDGVDQLDKFNKALERECVDSSRPRGIDGIVLTKFDTIDDKVGAAISMTYISGQPIMFVGTGQTYADLKRMNIKTLIKALLK